MNDTGRVVWRAALGLSFLIWFLVLISLPIGITYDGFGYIDMADVLGSDRFPRDWLNNRTPLYPLVLKFCFWLLGRQALAAIAAGSLLTLAGTVLLGWTVHKQVGPFGGAAVLLLIILHPTLAAYQHLLLTESGTVAFISLILAPLLWRPTDRAALRWKLAALIAAVSGGFYWRQNLLVAAPLAAVMLYMDERRISGAARMGSRSFVVPATMLIVPLLAALPWNRYSNASELRNVTLRQGIVRQALVPPSDALVAPHADEYRQFIVESMAGGNFYSGVTWDRLTAISPKLFAATPLEDTPSLFVSLVLRYPDRYAAGFWRTALFFSGAPGYESDNTIYRDQIFSTAVQGSKISDGPEPLRGQIASQFRQMTTNSFVLRLGRALFYPYDLLIIAGAFMTLCGFVAAVLFRDSILFAFTALPLVYLVSYAVFLVSLDRFMIPIHPLFLTNLVIAPWLAVRRIRQRTGLRRTLTAPMPHEAIRSA